MLLHRMKHCLQALIMQLLCHAACMRPDEKNCMRVIAVLPGRIHVWCILKTLV